MLFFYYIVSRELNRIIYRDETLFSHMTIRVIRLITLNYMKYLKCALIRMQFIFDNCFLIVSAIHRRLQIPVNYLQIWGCAGFNPP